MENNSIIVIKKALIGKKRNYYYPGDLEYVELKYNFIVENIEQGIRPTHQYNLNIAKSNQENEIVLDVAHNKAIFTMEEIGYFNYIINEFIQNKMNNVNN